MAKSTSVIRISTAGFKRIEANLNSIFLHSVVEPSQTTVRRLADDTAFVAREFAPIKTGALESAIEQARNVRRAGFVVEAAAWVNPHVWNAEAGLSTGAYAAEAHSTITPYGSKKLGALSQAKQGMLADQYDNVGVGGGFMTRAFNFVKKYALKDVAKSIREALAKYN